MHRITKAERNQNVKIALLNFWLNVINVTLKKQGMLDGSFPEATFSTELKRIIRFDRVKIQSCLSTALAELSRNECLETFVHVLKFENDPVVCEVAHKNLAGLIDLLNKYEVTSEAINVVHPKSTVYGFSQTKFSELLSPVLSPLSQINNLNSLEVDDLWNPSSEVSNKRLVEIRENVDTTTVHDFLKFINSEMETYNRHKLKPKPDNNLNNLIDSVLNM